MAITQSKLIRVGDSLAPHGGEVLTGYSGWLINTHPVARKGDQVLCHQHGLQTIDEALPDLIAGGAGVALEGHKASCGCTLVAGLSNWMPWLLQNFVDEQILNRGAVECQARWVPILVAWSEETYAITGYWGSRDPSFFELDKSLCCQVLCCCLSHFNYSINNARLRGGCISAVYRTTRDTQQTLHPRRARYYPEFSYNMRGINNPNASPRQPNRRRPDITIALGQDATPSPSSVYGIIEVRLDGDDNDDRQFEYYKSIAKSHGAHFEELDEEKCPCSNKRDRSSMEEFLRRLREFFDKLGRAPPPPMSFPGGASPAPRVCGRVANSSANHFDLRSAPMPMLPMTEPETDGFLLDICLFARINFLDSWTPEKRHTIVQCMGDYADLCGEHLYWQGTPTSRQVVRFKPSVFDRLDAWIDTGDQRETGFCCSVNGRAKTIRHPKSYSFRVLTQTKDDEEYGFLIQDDRRMGTIGFHVPWFWHAGNPNTSFTELFWRFANRLGAHSGYAGLGFSTFSGYSNRHYFGAVMNRMIWRWPPFILDDFPYDGTELRKGMREPGWLTLIGDGYLAQLGGADAVCQQLAPPITTRPYAGGLFIQAGPEPDPNMPSIFDPPPPGWYTGEYSGGDAESIWGRPPQFPIAAYPEYRAVNSIIKPLRVTPLTYPKTWQQPNNWLLPHSAFIFERPPADTWLSDETLHRWIARFDDPSPWESDSPQRLWACGLTPDGYEENPIDFTRLFNYK